MRLLLDTHTLIWFSENAPQLTPTAKAAIESEDNLCFYSAASIWEMAIKISLGKLRTAIPLDARFQNKLSRTGFNELVVQFDHALKLASMPFCHRDPFDRMLVAQAQIEGMAIVSKDAQFDAYQVLRIW